jgi:DNA-binding NtrC family response regulator
MNLPAVLLIDSARTSKTSFQKYFADEYTILTVSTADDAINLLSDTDIQPQCVVVEMTLAGHSGFEFLYEFRSYSDWATLPVIIYTSIDISAVVLESRSWKALQVTDYLYKPISSLSDVRDSITRAVSAA